MTGRILKKRWSDWKYRNFLERDCWKMYRHRAEFTGTGVWNIATSWRETADLVWKASKLHMPYSVLLWPPNVLGASLNLPSAPLCFSFYFGHQILSNQECFQTFSHITCSHPRIKDGPLISSHYWYQWWMFCCHTLLLQEFPVFSNSHAHLRPHMSFLFSQLSQQSEPCAIVTNLRVNSSWSTSSLCASTPALSAHTAFNQNWGRQFKTCCWAQVKRWCGGFTDPVMSPFWNRDDCICTFLSRNHKSQ